MPVVRLSYARALVRVRALVRALVPALVPALVALVVALVPALLAACGDNTAPPTVIAPRIVVVSPATGSVLPVASTQLAFRVTEAPAIAYSIALGDAPPTLVAQAIAIDEQVTATVDLAPGVNTVTIGVRGEDDTADEETVVIVVEEAAPPAFVIAAPANDTETYATTTTITGRIAAAHPITSATIQRGSEPATPLALVAAPGGATFSVAVDLVLGANELTLRARDDRDQAGEAMLRVARLLDDVAPSLAIEFPRDGQAVRTRSVVVRGHAEDAAGIASVAITAHGVAIAADVAPDGTFTASVPLEVADNALAVVATDGFGNATELAHVVYYGTRLASGAAHGGAIRGGTIYTWGRNNLGQTGLDFVSHESRTAFCDRTLATARDSALCKATTITAIDAICLNPAFATPTPADSPEAAACRAATRTYRDGVCDAAGTAAPANCKTSSAVNLATLCDTAYGTGTPASNACEAHLVCDGAYASGSADHASCVAVAGAVPSVFPAPPPPYAPVAIATAPGVAFTSLAFNQNASSALDATGQLWSWGDNASGQLCLGDTVDRKAPQQVAAFGAPGTTAIALARGYDHVLVLRSDGSVWACGLNGVGQLGDGTAGSGTNRSAPVQVQGLPATIIQVVASSQSSYALTADGQVYAWGRNQYGNLGNGTASTATTAAPVPALVPGLANVVMIASGRDHVLAVRRDGTLWAWGLNASHQVDASDANVLAPVQIAGVTDARAVYANGNQGFYEDAQGRLFGWGQNGSGNLGIPEDDDQPAPSAPVFGITGVRDVAIGALQGFALRGAQVFAWGWSFHGSLGAGASAIHTWPYRTPVLVQLPN